MEFYDIQRLYVKVCNGYDTFSIKKKIYFVKHHSYSDRCILRDKYDLGLSVARSSGLKSEQEYLDFFIERGWWSKSKEDDIRQNSAFIENLKKSREKLILESQKQSIDKTILEEQSKLNLILSERKSIIPITTEEYADKFYSRYYLHHSLFKDEKCIDFFYESQEELLELDDEIYNEIWSNISNSITLFKADNLKYLAATGFFQNLLILSGKNMSAADFYGKPICSLSINQSDLFSYASNYRRAINAATEKIPDYILNSPENLIDWCEDTNESRDRAKKLMDNTPNRNKTTGERSGRISSIVGATASDYKKLGIENGKKTAGTDLLASAQQLGGQMQIAQVVKKTDDLK